MDDRSPSAATTDPSAAWTVRRALWSFVWVSAVLAASLVPFVGRLLARLSR